MTGYTGMWKPPASFRNLHPHPNCTQSVAVNNGLFARAVGHIQWVVVGGCSGSVCWCRVPRLQGECIFFLFNFFPPSTIEQRKQAVWTHVYLSFLRSIFFSFLFFYIKIVADYFQGTDKSQCFHCTLWTSGDSTLLRVLNQSNSMKRTHLYGCGCWVFCQK